MQKVDYGKKAIAVHKKLKGKISVTPKAAVKSRNDLSVYYTPGVGFVSSFVAKNPKVARDYTMKGNTVAVVSDGSAVLGLGNIGPLGALPVMEGKAMLFKVLADVDAIPIVLATQDTEEIIRAVKAIAPGFGGINLEDIAAPRCFEIERRLSAELDIPVMHDDQRGTALVVLAGLINALRVVKKQPQDVRVVISGAGAAGQAVVELLLLFGVSDIVVTDSRGIISRERPDLDPYKKELARKTNRRNLSGDLARAIEGADVFVGVSKPGILTAAHVRSMASGSIIFALANPIPEIMPDVARKAGVAVMATGRSDFPNQVNNSLGFPGIFRGALDNRVKEITNEMLLRGAQNLAALVKKPTAQNIMPDTFDKRVVKAVAKAIK